MNIDVKYKKLYADSKVPTYGSEEAAGCDLYAHLDELQIRIEPHTTVKVGSGMSFELPKGYAGYIFARSGLATKRGLRPANCVGVCDSDYTGEYIVAVHNDTDVVQVINHNDRIAQVVFMPVCQANFIEVEELTETERGSGGFGSTGTN